MKEAHAVSPVAALWDPGRSPQRLSTARSGMIAGIGVVFPVLHTPYYVYERLK
jgi:hypothetical protein